MACVNCDIDNRIFFVKFCLQWKMLTLCQKLLQNAQIMLEIEDYAFPFGLCFSSQIMLKIMLAYCINAYS